MATRLWREIEGVKPRQGLTMAALLGLPDTLRGLLAWMVRRGPVPAGEVCEHLGEANGACAQLLLALQDKGLVRVVSRGGEPFYQVWLVLERARSNFPRDTWDALSLDL